MKSALVVLSGGLDSTTALALTYASPDYDTSKFQAITFSYGQKQSAEIELAKKTCEFFGIKHTVVDISFLGQMSKGVCANIKGTDINMPTIEDVLGQPQPVTYVPNRNMILLSIAASYAEANGLDTIVCGFQSNDTYGYHDTTSSFVDKINATLAENRTFTITVTAPFVDMTKADEIAALREIYGEEGAINILQNTLTCYNPNNEGESCGVCPSCTERLSAFAENGMTDPVAYSI